MNPLPIKENSPEGRGCSNSGSETTPEDEKEVGPNLQQLEELLLTRQQNRPQMWKRLRGESSPVRSQSCSGTGITRNERNPEGGNGATRRSGTGDGGLATDDAGRTGSTGTELKNGGQRCRSRYHLSQLSHQRPKGARWRWPQGPIQ